MGVEQSTVEDMQSMSLLNALGSHYKNSLHYKFLFVQKLFSILGPPSLHCPAQLVTHNLEC